MEYATLQAEYDKLDRDLTVRRTSCVHVASCSSRCVCDYRHGRLCNGDAGRLRKCCWTAPTLRRMCVACLLCPPVRLVVCLARLTLPGIPACAQAWLDEEDFLEQCRSRLHALVQAGSAGTLTEGAFARILDTNDMLVKVLARAHTGTGASNDELARISAATRHLPASTVDDFDGAGAGAGAGDDEDFFGSMGPGAAAPAPASSAASDLAGLFTPAAAAPASAPAPAPAPTAAAPAPSVPAKETAAATADDPFAQLANRNSGSTIKPKSADEAAALLAVRVVGVAAVSGFGGLNLVCLRLQSLNMGTSATAKPATAVAAQPPPAPVTAAPSPAPATTVNSAVPAPSAEDGARCLSTPASCCEFSCRMPRADDFEAFLDEQAAMFGADTGDSAAASGGNDLSMDELDDILKGSS